MTFAYIYFKIYLSRDRERDRDPRSRNEAIGWVPRLYSQILRSEARTWLKLYPLVPSLYP